MVLRHSRPSPNDPAVKVSNDNIFVKAAASSAPRGSRADAPHSASSDLSRAAGELLLEEAVQRGQPGEFLCAKCCVRNSFQRISFSCCGSMRMTCAANFLQTVWRGSNAAFASTSS
eukprot:RCo045291